MADDAKKKPVRFDFPAGATSQQIAETLRKARDDVMAKEPAQK